MGLVNIVRFVYKTLFGHVLKNVPQVSMSINLSKHGLLNLEGFFLFKKRSLFDVKENTIVRIGVVAEDGSCTVVILTVVTSKDVGECMEVIKRQNCFKKNWLMMNF